MTLVHTDSRRRVSLGKLLEADRDYRVSVSPHGTVTLEPVTTISDYERGILANSALAARLEVAVSDIDRGATTPTTRRTRTGASEA